MRTVVIVSPFYVPSPRASVHRARHLARHLPACGWRPIVLCVDEKYHQERLDTSLGALVGDGSEVVKVAALPAAIGRAFGIGDITLRGWWQLRAGLLHVLQSQRIDAVLITAPPNYALLLAPIIEKRFGVPVVLDLQDPWVSPWGTAQPRRSKAGLSHAIATRLEPRAIAAAAFLTVISEKQREALLAQYVGLARTRTAAIPIGCDEEDLRVAMRMDRSPADAAFDRAGNDVNISYVGSYWPAAQATFAALLRGLARLRADQSAHSRRMKLHFIGTDATARDGRPQVKPMAEAMGIGDMVHEAPERVGYLQALRIMARSDGLLLIGSDEPHYSASKIHAALMSGRPYLSIYHGSSDAHRLLQAAGGGVALSFPSRQDLPALDAAIAEGLWRLGNAPASLGKADSAIYGRYDAPSIAEKFGAVLDRVAGRSMVA